MARRSVGCATTQMTELSRRASEQIAHGSRSVRLQQIEQRRILSRTSRMASASSRACASGERRMWNARRVAVLSPMPGSRPRRRMSLWIGSVATRPELADGGPAGDVETAGHLGHLGLLELLGLGDRLA